MEQAFVSAAALPVWVDQLQELGERAEHVIASGQHAGALRPSGGAVPLAEFVALTEGVAAAADDPTLGWQLGTRYDLAQLDVIGSALLTSRTVGDALSRFVGYFGLMQDAAEMSLRVGECTAVLSYRILDPEIWPRHQDAIYTLGILAQLLRRGLGMPWERVELQLETEDAEACARLALRAGLPCRSGGTTNSLRFPAAFLSLPLQGGSEPRAVDLKLLDRQLVQKRRAMLIDTRVRSLVYQQLGHRGIDQEEIARGLGMSSRTLRRHLASVGTSFQALVDECRMRQAAHEFRVRRTVSIAQTALRLGYSEHSTFTRAFSRWSGMPPQSFIRSHGLSARAMA
jgi:AraC-like DNA-binding protein